MRYDTAGNVIEQVDPAGNKTTWAYDAGGRVTAAVSPRGYAPGATPAKFTTIITRDRFGLPVATKDPLGRTSSMSYDGNHVPIRTVDGENRATALTLDAEGQATRQVVGGRSERWSYDADGRPTTHADGAGRVTTTAYDAAGRPVSQLDPLGRATKQAYDVSGRATVTTDAIGRRTTQSYDAAGRITKVDFSDPGTADVAFTYDVDGRRTQMADGTGKTTYAYDGLDRITSIRNGAGKTVGYGYDLADQVTSLVYPNGKAVKLTFDALGRMTTVTDWLANTTRFAYDQDSNETLRTYPAATKNVDKATYDATGQITRLAYTGAAGTTSSLAVAYDRSGRRTTETASKLPVAPKAFGYDTAGRLAKADTLAYAYDTAGNITRLGAATMTYDVAAQLTSSTTSAGKTTYAFDDLGQRVHKTSPQRAVTEYGYDQAGQLTSVDPAPAAFIRYGYDGEGLRTSKSRAGVTTSYVWDGLAEVPLLLAEGTTSYVHGPDGKPLERIDAAGVVTFFHLDAHGNVRSLTDKAGKVVATFSWDAYGNSTGSTGTVRTPFGYAGEFRDADTGLIHLRARDYDPSTGQFISRDPAEAMTGEPYLYASGDPVNRTDPLGLWSIGGFGMGVSEFSAGILDSASFGLSTQLAGAAFGFDADCTDFGAGFAAGQFVGDLNPRGVIKRAVRGGLKRGMRFADEGAGAARLPRYNGPKPRYEVNRAHVPGQGLRSNKTPLPADAEDVFRTAVPSHPHDPQAWFGQNAEGQIYRFSSDGVGGAHFSGIDGVGDGVRNLNDYALGRLAGK